MVNYCNRYYLAIEKRLLYFSKNRGAQGDYVKPTKLVRKNNIKDLKKR